MFSKHSAGPALMGSLGGETLGHEGGAIYCRCGSCVTARLAAREPGPSLQGRQVRPQPSVTACAHPGSAPAAGHLGPSLPLSEPLSFTGKMELAV